MQLSNRFLGALVQSNENLSSHKNLAVYVYSSFIHNSPKLETAQMFFYG